MINIAILVNGENKEFLSYLFKIIARVFKNYKRKVNIDKYSNGSELIKNVEFKLKYYEIIIIEVSSGNLNGFEIANYLREIESEFLLIFIGNTIEEAINGYKYWAYRFLLKENIETEINEAFSYLLNSEDSIIVNNITFKVIENNSYETIEVKEKDIVQLYKKQRKTFLETTYNTYELLQYTLKHYEREIGKDNFNIVFRSHLINFDNVVDLKGDYFILENGNSVCLGTKKEIIDKIRLKYINYKVKKLH